MRRGGIEPIYAQGFFTVGPDRVFQIVEFDYRDDEGYYWRLTRREDEYQEEAARLAAAMQEELDKEAVVVNGVRTRPVVEGVAVNFRGGPRHVTIVFLIQFEAPFRRGLNVYENEYEGVVAEYDYTAYWFFPPGYRVVEVLASGRYDVIGPTDNILVIWARAGDEIKGYERIVFRAP